MSLHEKIKETLKAAMKEKNAPKLAAVRGLLAALTNEAVNLGHKPDEILPDPESLVVIKRAAKQRQDSIAQFSAGGRADLAASEQAELAFIETYLPTLMSRAEIKKIAAIKKQELGITNKSQTGKFIGALMKELGGRADGALVKTVAEELLN